MSEVAEHIRTKSEELTIGKSKITSTEIYLRIFRKNFVDLTLVDLPGLYYGDGMTETIKNIYTSFISNSNSIILYVTAAVSDLNTGESLEIARKHDPEIKRTLTIVTKIDKREPLTFKK